MGTIYQKPQANWAWNKSDLALKRLYSVMQKTCIVSTAVSLPNISREWRV